MKTYVGLAVAAGLFAGIESLTVRIGVVLAFCAAVAAFHKQVIKPCATAIISTTKRVTQMVDTVEDLPERLESIGDRLERGDARMSRIEQLAVGRDDRLEKIEQSLAVMRDDDAQIARQALTAAAVRHATVVTEDDVRVHWRD